MPNEHYTKGRRKEYTVAEKLIKAGYDIVQRSAGSHSPVDVWAVSMKKKKILLIQCKPENFSGKNEYEEWAWLNDKFDVEFEIR